MKLTIFSRLIIGYLVIFILAMAMTTYTIAQLRQLEKVTSSILMIDNLLINYEQKLSDALLSMMRYEKKYIIIGDKGLYDHFVAAKGYFEKNLTEIMSLTKIPEAKNQIKKVEDFYQHYQSSFEEEVVYLNSGNRYPADEFRKEKETAVNGIMEALKEFRNYYQRNTYDKIKKLNIVEAHTLKMAIIIGVSSLIFGIVISIYITLGITRPLSIIKRRTRDIANGNFKADLAVSSPPEIKELTEAFNSMCTKLKEIDKMKSDFFSLMSHELRTPLTTIKESTNLFIEGLNGGKAIDKKKRLLTIINEECNRLITLVNSLLDLSKMEAGMIVYNFSQADLVSLIKRVTREMEPLAKTKNIKIETKAKSGLPFIKMDCDRILQVMRNLIGNALKFTPNGGNVRVSARTNGYGLMVSIADTGIGISEEKLSVIFDKYKQATLESPNKIIGSGLGLFIVKEIINAHGGEVWAESTFGKGSTFTFVLPY